MKLFLKAKHWQLFLLMLIPVFVSSGVMIYYYIDLLKQVSLAPNDISFDFSKLIEASVWMTIWGLFSFLIYALWMLAVNMNLRNKLSPALRDSSVRFTVVYLIPVLYMLFIPFFMYYMFSGFISGGLTMQDMVNDTSFSEDLFQKTKVMLPIYFCLYLLYIPAYIYLGYRTGKILKKLETKTNVGLSDFFVEIILVLFFPIIGVWLLQPKINKYVEYEDWDESQTPPPSPI